MPYFETRILGLKHEEPYLTKCKRSYCYFDECKEIEYSCIGIRIVEHEIVIGFSFPDVADNDKAYILRCADEAIYISSGIIVKAVEFCVELDLSSIPRINRSIALADENAKEEFLKCLIQSDLDEETINACRVEVFIREYYG